MKLWLSEVVEKMAMKVFLPSYIFSLATGGSELAKLPEFVHGQRCTACSGSIRVQYIYLAKHWPLCITLAPFTSG